MSPESKKVVAKEVLWTAGIIGFSIVALIVLSITFFLIQGEVGFEDDAGPFAFIAVCSMSLIMIRYIFLLLRWAYRTVKS
jgi:hypothetical protein